MNALARQRGEVATPFDVTAEEIPIATRRLRLWRPLHPEDLEGPDAKLDAVGPVWAQTWISGLVLAGIVGRCVLHGLRVLELGCGLGLVALAAASAGGDVTVNDRSKYALAFTSVNAEDNGLRVQTVQCDWASPQPLEQRGPWDLVVGSDVMYDDRSVPALLALLGRIVSPDGEVWLADPGRAPATGFVEAARHAWRLTARPCGHGVTLHRLAPSGRPRQ